MPDQGELACFFPKDKPSHQNLYQLLLPKPRYQYPSNIYTWRKWNWIQPSRGYEEAFIYNWCPGSQQITQQNNFTVHQIIHVRIFFFLGPHQGQMEVSSLGVESELQLLAYATATARGDMSRVCDLRHSSWQRQITDPLSKARDHQTHNLMDTSQICFSCSMTGTLPVRTFEANYSYQADDKSYRVSFLPFQR